VETRDGEGGEEGLQGVELGWGHVAVVDGVEEEHDVLAVQGGQGQVLPSLPVKSGARRDIVSRVMRTSEL